MLYCGLDIAMKSSYLYITDANGQKQTSGELATTKAALSGRLRPHLGGGLSVAIEAGNQTAWIHDLLVDLGATVNVVHPKKVKLLAARRCKTDKIDAKTLCELLRIHGLPRPVHMPGVDTRALRGLLVARRPRVTARTKVCNGVRGMVRQEGVYPRAGGLSSQVGWQSLLERGFEPPHLLPIVSASFESFKATNRLSRRNREQGHHAESWLVMETARRHRWPSRPERENGRLRFDRTSLVCGVQRQREWEVGQSPRRQALMTLTRLTSWERCQSTRNADDVTITNRLSVSVAPDACP